jgi:peptide/nickel transport system ATP-binding protein
MDAAVIRVENLKVELGIHAPIEVLHGVDLEVYAGTMHGLVGETGSGKSITARAVVGLLPTGGRITAGAIFLGDRALVGLDEKTFRAIRGPQIGMIFQNPRTALYPMLDVQTQMMNVLRSHLDLSRRECIARIHHYLRLAGINDAERVARSYAHELSGGLAQRVVIATALLCEPIILIADEPTTGLDATVQRQILELLADLQEQLSLAVLMITHDLAIIAQYCDVVSVMRDGIVVEHGSMRDVVLAPSGDYTQRLLQASRLGQLRGSG